MKTYLLILVVIGLASLLSIPTSTANPAKRLHPVRKEQQDSRENSWYQPRSKNSDGYELDDNIILRFTKTIIRRETKLYIKDIIEEGRSGIEILLNSMASPEICGKSVDPRVCKATVERINSNNSIAILEWLKVFRMLTPICRNPPYQMSLKETVQHGSRSKKVSRRKRFISLVALLIAGVIGVLGVSAGISAVIAKAEVKPVKEKIAENQAKTGLAIKDIVTAQKQTNEDLNLNYRADALGDIAWREQSKAANIKEKLGDRSTFSNELTNARTFHNIYQKQIADATNEYGDLITVEEKEQLKVILTSNTESLTKVMGTEDHDCESAHLKSEIYTLVPEIDGRSYVGIGKNDDRYRVDNLENDHSKVHWVNNNTIRTELPIIPRQYKEVVAGRRITTEKDIHLVFAKAENIMTDRFTIVANDYSGERGLIDCQYRSVENQKSEVILEVGQEILLPVTCSLISLKINFTRLNINMIDADTELPEELGGFNNYQIIESLSITEVPELLDAEEIAEDLLREVSANEHLGDQLGKILKDRGKPTNLGEIIGGSLSGVGGLFILTVLWKCYKKLGGKKKEEKRKPPESTVKDEPFEVGAIAGEIITSAHNRMKEAIIQAGIPIE